MVNVERLRVNRNLRLLVKGEGLLVIGFKGKDSFAVRKRRRKQGSKTIG